MILSLASAQTQLLETVLEHTLSNDIVPYTGSISSCSLRDTPTFYSILNDNHQHDILQMLSLGILPVENPEPAIHITAAVQANVGPAFLRRSAFVRFDALMEVISGICCPWKLIQFPFLSPSSSVC